MVFCVYENQLVAGIVLWKRDRGGVCQNESGQDLHRTARGTGRYQVPDRYNLSEQLFRSSQGLTT